METVILIKVESIADLELSANFIAIETSTGNIYRGNPDDPTLPIKIMDENSTNFRKHFLLMGA